VVEEFDVLALKALRDLGLFQNDLPTVVVERELGAHVALLAVTQDTACWQESVSMKTMPNSSDWPALPSMSFSGNVHSDVP
jgi:hypothetical protein